MTAKLKDDVGPEDFGISALDAEKARHYAAFLVAAERERCAQVCEATPIIGRSDPEAFGFSNALETCAAAIRRA